MIRLSARLAGAAVLVALSLPMCNAAAQQQVPAAPAQAPSAPAPAAAPEFPKPDPANFTATSPTKEVINAFLQTSWGYDENRIWQVQAIMKTPVEGVSKVVDYRRRQDRQAEALRSCRFFAMPDGKHIIAGDEILPFGEHPYADYRALLQAEGRRSLSRLRDRRTWSWWSSPTSNARIARRRRPTWTSWRWIFPRRGSSSRTIRWRAFIPRLMTAAAYGVCVDKLGGSTAFFQFASAVFEGQEGLATPDGATLTLNSAVTKAGLDPAKVAACAATPAVAAQVEASVKLAQDLNINQTPTLMVNGRQVPIGGVPYDTIKKIVEYQAKLDGVSQ